MPEITPALRMDMLAFMFIHALRIPMAVEMVRGIVAKNHPDADQRMRDNFVLDSMEGFRNRNMSAFARANFDKTLCCYFAPAGSALSFITSDRPVLFAEAKCV